MWKIAGSPVCSFKCSIKNIYYICIYILYILDYKPSFFKPNFTMQVGGSAYSRVIQYQNFQVWKYYQLPLLLENSLNHTYNEIFLD
ncbi:hypothetical protein LDENG_00064430 [Lucifuga dentata]|nr:hypothetical protein LDENG_00064430 [Lucifuga dentata]